MSEKITNHKSQITNRIDAIALIGVIALAAVRLLVTFRSVWTWDMGTGQVTTDVGPIGTAITDMLCVVTLMVAMIGAIMPAPGSKAGTPRGGKRKTHIGLVVLWLMGAGGAMLHVAMGTGDLFIAGNWIGATALGLAAMFVAETSGGRRMVLAGVMALGAAIGLDAVWQVTVQHGWTVRDYQQHKQEFLKQHQWEEGSVEQQKFEVRLMQNEATGAVGLSNVFGTAAGAVTLMGAGWVMAVWKKEDDEDKKEEEKEGVEASEARAARGVRRRFLGAVGGCALLGLAALVCTFSKGAILACALVGGVMGGVAYLTSAKPQAAGVWRNVAFLLVMLGVMAVVGRWWVLGVQTTPGGECSLLFRGFYWQAAAKMVMEEPVTGIGPGRFQDMYMVLKNPLSPEDVAQPHNVEVAWVSQLGLAGWAWVVMIGVMLWRSAPGSEREEGRFASPAKLPEEKLSGAVPGARWAVGIIAAGLAFGTQYGVQVAEMLPETAAMWAIGAVLFAVIVGYSPAMRLNERWLSIGALAAAVMALLHSQIDMGLTNAMTGPVLMVVIGAAAAAPAGSSREEGVEVSGNGRWGVVGGVLLLLLMGVMLGGWWIHVDHAGQVRWNATVRWAAYQAGEYGVAAGPGRGPVSIEPRDVNMMAQAAFIMARCEPDRRADWLETGWRWYVRARNRPMRLAGLWRGEAGYDVSAWELTGETVWRTRAIEAIAEAVSYDPYGTQVHVDAGEMMEKLGDHEAASGDYAAALKWDAMKYLDPDSRLPADERKELERRLARSR